MKIGILLNSANLVIKAATWIKASIGNKIDTMDSLPLGDTVGDGTGTIGLKVLSLGLAGGSSSTLGTPTNVAANATSVQLTAANALRKGVTIKNHSDKVLHLSLSGTATANNSLVDLAAETTGLNGGYWECPYNYTGVITGIWEAGPTGNANITVFT